MKKVIIMVMLILVLFSFSVYAVPEVQETNTIIINKIDSEHKNTRQFLSDEMQNMKDSGISEFTKRGDYYETAYRDITNWFLIKLGMIWAGVLLFVMSLNKLFSLMIEKKKYNLYKETIKKEIIDEFNKGAVEIPSLHGANLDKKIEKKKFNYFKNKNVEKKLVEKKSDVVYDEFVYFNDENNLRVD